jgi:hypothetical protein
MIFELNEMIAKIYKFYGLADWMRSDLEMMYQINNFSRIYGKKSLELNMKLWEDCKINYLMPRLPLKRFFYLYNLLNY